jgi:hypothetical protein
MGLRLLADCLPQRCPWIPAKGGVSGDWQWQQSITQIFFAGFGCGEGRSCGYEGMMPSFILAAVIGLHPLCLRRLLLQDFFVQIRSKDRLNSFSLIGRARSRFRIVLLIHHT